MRLIDADTLLPMLKLATTDSAIGVFPIMIGFDTIAKVLGEAPTIDAVPVIRCKDCVHRTEYGYCTLYINFHHLTADMDYCSDGERKEE